MEKSGRVESLECGLLLSDANPFRGPDGLLEARKSTGADGLYYLSSPNVCVCVCLCVCACVYVPICVCVYLYVSVCVSVSMCVSV